MKITPLSQARRFIQDESGVYTVMGGLLALPILALIFVSLESAGIIQDQARLSDSLEQAVLSLTAENNSGRKDNDYKLSGSNKENDSFDISSEVGKRDSQMVTKFVKAFLPQTDEKNMHLTPLCKTINNNSGKGHTSSSEVTCTVSGTVEHKSWFPLKVGNLEVIPKQVNVASKSKALKKNTFNIPIDLMVVADLSGSMKDGIKGEKLEGGTNSKIYILREVLKELADKSLFTQESNEYNRIGITAFAMGAEHPKENKCVLPFVLQDNLHGMSKIKIKQYLASRYNRTTLKRTEFVDNFVALLDIEKTLNSIGQTNYDITFPKSSICLEGLKNASQFWYTKTENDKFRDRVNSLKANGGTLASSGLLTASNQMLSERSRSEELNQETKRVILVLSDGNDDMSNLNLADLERNSIPFTNFSRITKNLIFGRKEDLSSTPKTNKAYNTRSSTYQYNTYLTDKTKNIIGKGMCSIIQEKLNALNKDENTKLVFVEFGYRSESADAWKTCVGNGNYFYADNRESLLNSFKQAIGETDDVGRSIN
ncbi:pilus assembly protein [Actinobacillus pleuropneumoniae]|uniref:pilus assembly protein n=1 Tax=Actinobacillus pleuropneumoniae TaxID=715 RepID=UPI003D05A48C